jgi:sulfur carrier protein ThiS
LNVRINGARIGEEVRVSAGESVAIVLESNLAQSEEVALYANGSVLQKIAVPAGPHIVTTQIRITRSTWISARSSRVLTSPVYVLVGGLPVRPSPESACYFMRYIDYLIDTVTSKAVLGDEEPDVLHTYAAARAAFRDRFREGGGTDCP